MNVRPGSRLKSAVCDTEVIVVRAPSSDVDLRCGGASMLPHNAVADAVPDSEVVPGGGDGTKLGKRYSSHESELVLLCTKAGQGSLSVGDTRLELMEAKPLPSSD